MWPSAGRYQRPPIHVRVMDWMRFSNSKTYFNVLAQRIHKTNVVTLHMNYEGFAEKHDLMMEVGTFNTFPMYFYTLNS